MTMKKRLLALGLSLSMIFSLAACSKDDGQSTQSPDPTATTSQEVEEEIVADLSQSILEFSAGITGDTTVMTVNGTEVPADLALYWLALNCSYYEGGYGIDVSQFADTLREDSVTATAYYVLLQQKAQELGCPLTDEQMTQVQETLMADGQDVYDQRKAVNGLSDSTMEFIYSISSYYDNVLAATIAAPTTEELNNYVYQTRHILLSTVDENNQPISDEDKAAQLAKAEDILAQLNASDDVSTLFDELMNEYSEDPGLSSSPDGYTATIDQMSAPELGQMVEPYQEASLALAVGEVSGIVESEFGYHIIIRDEVADIDQYSENWKDYKMNQQVEQWLNEATIETTDILDNLDVADFYNKFSAYQVALVEQYEAESTEDTEPTETPESTESTETTQSPEPTESTQPAE